MVVLKRIILTLLLACILTGCAATVPVAKRAADTTDRFLFTRDK